MPMRTRAVSPAAACVTYYAAFDAVVAYKRVLGCSSFVAPKSDTSSSFKNWLVSEPGTGIEHVSMTTD